VNCISPGLVPDTPYWEKLRARWCAATVQQHDRRHSGPAARYDEDIVHGTFFLMDNRAVDESISRSTAGFNSSKKAERR